MPTYEYACTSCGERLEVVQKFTDDPLTTCPACSGTLRKLFSAVGVVFKGSGFYKTDSRSTTSGKSGSKTTSDGAAEKKESASTSGGSAGSTDSGGSSSKSTDSGSTSTPSTSSSGSSGDRVA